MPIGASFNVRNGSISCSNSASLALTRTLPGNKALLAQLNLVNQDLGLGTQPPLDPLKRGAGDISFVANDVDGLVGLGAFSTGDHAPGETVDLASIKRQAKRAAILMTRLTHGK